METLNKILKQVASKQISISSSFNLFSISIRHIDLDMAVY